jgi:hypothetical protein
MKMLLFKQPVYKICFFVNGAMRSVPCYAFNTAIYPLVHEIDPRFAETRQKIARATLKNPFQLP